MGKNLPTLADGPFWDGSEEPIPSSFLGIFSRRNGLIILFGLLGLVFLSAGIFSSFSGSKEKDTAVVIEESKKGEGKLKVDVSGAVVHPGVYELSAESRVQEALISAGGIAASADRDWTAKNLNLAAKLTDGAKIYIPAKDESAGSGNSSLTWDTKGSEKVNINRASLSELDGLWGIGPATAQKILNGRPYQTIDDLVAKKILSASVFEKIKEQITVW